MKVIIAIPPAYFSDLNRHFVSGSRWSYSMYGRKVKEGLCPSHYPFYVGYSSALLKRDTESTIKAVDGTATDMKTREFADIIIKEKPDLLVLEVQTVSFPFVMALAKKLKNVIGCKVAIAGGHVTCMYVCMHW